MRLKKTFRFEASHQLPRHTGKCKRLHGHSWILHVYVDGPINTDSGFVQDYNEISSAVKPLIENWLDHYHLNDRLENPTSENLLLWIAGRLEGFTWSALELEETCTSSALLEYAEYLRLSLKGELPSFGSLERSPGSN